MELPPSLLSNISSQLRWSFIGLFQLWRLWRNMWSDLFPRTLDTWTLISVERTWDRCCEKLMRGDCGDGFHFHSAVQLHFLLYPHNINVEKNNKKNSTWNLRGTFPPIFQVNSGAPLLDCLNYEGSGRMWKEAVTLFTCGKLAVKFVCSLSSH